MLFIVDRYIGRQFLLFFVCHLLLFYVIFVCVDLVSRMGSFHQVGFGVLFGFYIYSLPEILKHTMPLACLAGSMLTFFMLNRRHELMGFWGVGLGLLRLSWPILVLVSLISAMIFVLEDRVFPEWIEKRRQIYLEIKKRPHHKNFRKTDKIWYASEGALLYVEKFNWDHSTAQDVSIYHFNKMGTLTRHVQASFAKMNGGLWDLQEGWEWQFTEIRGIPKKQEFKSQKVVIGDVASSFQVAPKYSRVMSWQQLKGLIEKNKRAGLETIKYEWDYYQRFAMLFSNIIMSFFGIPFSIQWERSGGASKSIVMGLVTIILYVLCLQFLSIFVYQSTLPPFVAAWIPNTIILGVALWAFLRLRR